MEVLYIIIAIILAFVAGLLFYRAFVEIDIDEVSERTVVYLIENGYVKASYNKEKNSYSLFKINESVIDAEETDQADRD